MISLPELLAQSIYDNDNELLFSTLPRMKKTGNFDVMSEIAKNLHIAAKNGNIKVVSGFIEEGGDLGKCASTLLSLPIYESHYAIVKILIDAGAQVPKGADDLLSVAVSRGWVDVMKVLIDEGADIYSYGRSFLRQAAQNNHTSAVKYLLEAGFSQKEEIDSALFSAVCFGSLEAGLYLILKGADTSVITAAALESCVEDGKYDESLIFREFTPKHCSGSSF